MKSKPRNYSELLDSLVNSYCKQYGSEPLPETIVLFGKREVIHAGQTFFQADNSPVLELQPFDKAVN